MAGAGLVLVGVALLWLLSRAYQRLRNPLRRFPSSPGAALSSAWVAWQTYMERRSQAIWDQHSKHGSVVRIGPDHVSFSDPRAIQDIYGHGRNFQKSSFYNCMANDPHRSIVNVRDRDEHARKRKMLSAAFAQKNILVMEDTIATAIRKLLARFDRLTEESKPVDVRWWFNLFTLDVIGSVGFGKDFGLLDSGEDAAATQSLQGTPGQMPHLISGFHEASLRDVTMGNFPGLLKVFQTLTKYTKAAREGTNYNDLCINKVRESTAIDIDQPMYFFDHFLFSRKGEKIDLPFEELQQEAAVLINAGSDTTQTAMTNLMYQLMSNPRVLDKLRKEVDDLYGSVEDPIRPYNDVVELKYLRACIDESLRLNPSITHSLGRETPDGGGYVAGEWINAKTTVSISMLAIHHDANLFSNPEEFRPERWLEEPEAENCRKFSLPFSQGGRACIGRNLAYFEQQIVIAALIHRYHMDFTTPEFRLTWRERFIRNAESFPVKLRRRTCK